MRDRSIRRDITTAVERFDRKIQQMPVVTIFMFFDYYITTCVTVKMVSVHGV